MTKILAYCFPWWLFVYSIYSFSQTDPNLIFFQNVWFVEFQQAMWQLGFNNRIWAAIIFLSISILLYASYVSILLLLRQKMMSGRRAIAIFGLSVACLLPAYPALSHDVFNYVFNAKMVLSYHANPHVLTAMDFPEDPWLRFMHNIHTPAPYGYGWTAISLAPYLLGGGYLKAELLIFKLMMVGSLLICLWLLQKIQKVDLYQLGLLAFNPLVLIEIVGNAHNDLVMMALALGGFVLVMRAAKMKRWWRLCLGILLFGLSVSVKYSTILLIPAWVIGKLVKKLPLPQWLILSQILPLLTNRSQRFLPWYLNWSLVFLPLVQNSGWVRLMIAASFAGLTSYGLILYHGDYSPILLIQRSVWLFGVPSLYLMFELILKKKHEYKD